MALKLNNALSADIPEGGNLNVSQFIFFRAVIIQIIIRYR